MSLSLEDSSSSNSSEIPTLLQNTALTLNSFTSLIRLKLIYPPEFFFLAFLTCKFTEHLLNSALYCAFFSFDFMSFPSFLKQKASVWCSPQCLTQCLALGSCEAGWKKKEEVHSRVSYLGDVCVIFEPVGHAPISPHIQGIPRGFGSIWAHGTGTQIIQVIINIKYRKFVELSRIG